MALNTLLSRIQRKLVPEKPLRPVAVRCESSFVGSRYGGCPVYLPPLGPESVAYAVGVGEDTSFDEALIDRVGCVVHSIDPTPKSAAWIEKRRASGEVDDRLKFYQWALAAEDGTAEFAMPNNEDHVSGSLVNHGNVGDKTMTVTCRSVDSIAREFGHDRVDVLKLDIEGAEYDVVPSILSCGVPIGQILLEFHARFVEDGQRRTEELLDTMIDAGYGIFAVATGCRHYSLVHESVLKA